MANHRKYTNEQFIEAVNTSETWSEVHRKLGLCIGGGTYVYLQQLAKKLEISTSHMKGRLWSKGKSRIIKTRFPIDQILVKESTYQSTNYLKQRLIREGIKEHRCEVCRGTEWRDFPIPLELDHINGIRSDNRIENLRLLCPNCHAQTETYCRSNK